jgi:hypothetical protein
MPKNYGTGLYGKGNYSALTATTDTAAQGSYTLTGQAISNPIVGKMAAAFGSYALTGQAAGVNALSWAVATGSYTVSGQAVLFSQSNLWTAEADTSATWTPQTPAADPWTAVSIGTNTWTPQTPASDPWSPVIPGSTTWTPN